MNKKDISLYNMMFPVWGMFVYPGFWIITLPFNFIIDSLVLIIAMNIIKLEDKATVFKKSILKVFFFGYLADFIGSLLLFLVAIAFSGKLEEIDYLFSAPEKSPLTFMIVALAIVISALLIYYFNKKICFNNTKISEAAKHKLALALAVFTAPYFFMVGAELLFRLLGK